MRRHFCADALHKRLLSDAHEHARKNVFFFKIIIVIIKATTATLSPTGRVVEVFSSAAAAVQFVEFKSREVHVRVIDHCNDHKPNPTNNSNRMVAFV